MALVVFLRGVNVGGHKTFRPAVLAKQLEKYKVVNVGAAGTFVVRNPGSREKFERDLLKKLPFKTEVMICDGKDLLKLEAENPFTNEESSTDVVHFVSVLAKPRGDKTPLQFALPEEGDWLLRVIGSRGQFVFGMYRRQMKAIGNLGKLDKICGAPVTTRNWNTIATVARILKD